MRAADLITVLSRLAPDTEIYIAQPRHNYWKHVEATPVRAVSQVNIDPDGDIIDGDPGRFKPLFSTVFVLTAKGGT